MITGMLPGKNTIKRVVRVVILLMVAVFLLGASAVPPGNRIEQVRAYTRDIEFDYIAWTFNALGVKLSQLALQSSSYLPGQHERRLVLEYIDLIYQIQLGEAQLNRIYGDPDVQDPGAASTELRARLDDLYQKRTNLGPLAEAILQDQISEVVAENELSAAGQPVPPVLYHSTPLPLALIVSPRDAIRQEANISLTPDLTIEQRTALEDEVDDALNLSSLVVGIGGVGLYPTMVMQTSDLNWLSEVVAHEWVHNYLTLRPLGLNYLTSPELRTMNETAASIAGKELGSALIEKYYPELVPPPPDPTPPAAESGGQSAPPPFDFRAEMRETRVRVDELLTEGKVDEAEQYMEQRRAFFWENGYQIRKLNQAYFAFYGAYADQPGGAAGEDPVGAAVRELRAKSPSLAAFLNTISWMSSYEQLQRAVSGGT